MKSDEEIFSDREKEISSLKDTINELEAKLSLANRYLEASYNKEKEQQELMLQLQIQIDKLMQNKKNADYSSGSKLNSEQFKQMNDNSITINSQLNAGGSKLSSNKGSTQTSITNNSLSHNAKLRAKTAPNGQIIPSIIESVNENNAERKPRGVYSSPAVFNLERVMQNFRARSQLLAETLEENDCVLQKKFNSTFDVENDALKEENNHEGDFIEDEIEHDEEGR